MYLHIGNNMLVKTKNILGIFDLDTATISQTTKKYLAIAENAGRLRSADGDIPKSFVVEVNRPKHGRSPRNPAASTVYFTQISTSALKNRSL